MPSISIKYNLFYILDPNTTMIGKSATSGASTDKVPYLSMKWYYNEINEHHDKYNYITLG